MSTDKNNESLDSTEIAPNPEPSIRMNLVNTASEFLVSPSVQNSAMDMKIAFLKKKGLTDAEVDLAVKQADARLLATREQMSKSGAMMYYPPVLPPPISRWTTFRDIANSAILVGGFFYGAYWLYHTVVVPYLFGKKDGKSVDVRLQELDQTLSTCVQDISSMLSSLKEDIERLEDKQADTVHKDISDIKSEVTSLKKLLLNRKQFPSATVTPLTIPSWQIPENEEKQQQTPPEEEGNNSNGSESSLEMIKE